MKTQTRTPRKVKHLTLEQKFQKAYLQEIAKHLDGMNTDELKRVLGAIEDLKAQ